MRAGAWRCPCVWLVLLMVYVVGSLVFLSPPLDPVGTSTELGPRLLSAPGVDSIVFVALGPAARSPSLLYALASLREEGLWDGPVHVIVEHQDDLDCLASHLRSSVTIVVASGRDGDTEATLGAGGGGGDVASGSVTVNAKMAKMKLLDILPPSLERVIYVDCDVITQRPLASFLGAVGREWADVDRKAAAAAAAAAGAAARTPVSGAPALELLSPASGELPAPVQGRGMERLRSTGASNDNSGPSTLILFPDAAGHTVPVCSGCDIAHSGVVAVARGRSEHCLQLWHDKFKGDGRESKGTATDQEALDIALREGSGCEARWIDRHHLHFMKDPFVMAGLTRTSTFAHFTGLLHPERLSGRHKRHYEWFLGRSFDEWGQGVIKSCAVE